MNIQKTRGLSFKDYNVNPALKMRNATVNPALVQEAKEREENGFTVNPALKLEAELIKEGLPAVNPELIRRNKSTVNPELARQAAARQRSQDSGEYYVNPYWHR